MHLSCILSLLLVSSVTADNETWTPPALRIQHRRRQVGLPQGLGGGLPQAPGSDASSADSGPSPISANGGATRTIIDQRPPPSFTTTYGPVDFASVLPSISSSQLALISSLFSCDQTNAEYEMNTPATVLTHSTIPVPAMAKGLFVTSVGNEIRYTGCDGVPRITWSGGTPQNITSYISQFTLPASYVDANISTRTNWPCSLDSANFPSYCNQYQTMDLEYQRIYNSAYAKGTVYKDLSVQQINNTLCTSFVSLETPAAVTCTFGVGIAQLYYWPNPVYQNVSLCGPQPINVSGITPAPGQPTTQVVDGNTLTYPSVYVEFADISYSSESGNMSTTWTKANTFFPFVSDQVSSVCKTDGKTLPYNYRDLYGAVPWSAWGCANDCTSVSSGPDTLPRGLVATDSEGSCKSIDRYKYTFAPVIAWPSTFLSVLNSLNPVNADLCEFGFFQGGIYDPPRSLTAASWLTAPASAPVPATTDPVAVTLDPPTPSSSLQGPAAQTTTYVTPLTPSPTSVSPAPASSSPAPAAPAATAPSDPSSSDPAVGGVIASLVNNSPTTLPVAVAPTVPTLAPSSNPQSAEASSGGLGNVIASLLNQPLIPAPATPATTSMEPTVPFVEPVPAEPTSLAPQSASPQAEITIPGASAPITIVQGKGGQAVVGGTTVAASQPIALPDGHTASIGAGGVAVDGSSVAAFTTPVVTLAPSAPAAAAAPSTLAPLPVAVPGQAGLGAASPNTAAPAAETVPAATSAVPALVIGGSVVSQGSTATLAGGQVITIVPSGIAVSGSIIPVPTGAGPQQVTLPGGTTIPVAVVPSPAVPAPVVQAPAISIGGSIVPLSSVATLSGGVVITAEPSGIAVSGQIIAIPTSTIEQVTLPGGSTVSVANIPAAAQVLSIIVDSTVIPLNSATTLSNGETATFTASGVQIGTQIFAVPATSSSTPIILAGGTTLALSLGPAVPLAPAITVSGTTIPLDTTRITATGASVSYTPNGIQVDGQSYPIPVGQGSSTITLPNGSSLTVTAVPAPTTGKSGSASIPPAVVVQGRTIPLSWEATFASVTVSYGPNGLVVGTQMFPVPSGTSVEDITLSDGQVLTVSGVRTTAGAAATAVNGKATGTSVTTSGGASSVSQTGGVQQTSAVAGTSASPSAGGAEREMASLGGLLIAVLAAVLVL